MTNDHLLSLVIPVHNEAGNVTVLLDALLLVLAAPLSPTVRAWEVIWVDDGSTDRTTDELIAAAAGNDRMRILRLPRRCGQSAALWTGLSAARGEVIVTLDGDGQNDPADIPRLLEALERADMVVGHRVRRHDRLGKRAFAWLANGLRNWLTGSQIPDSGCGLKAFRREVAASFLPFEGLHRFLPTMAEIAGYRVLSIRVNHRPRKRGRSKYGVLDRLIGPLLDCLMLSRLKKRRLQAAEYEEIGPAGPVPAQAPAADHSPGAPGGTAANPPRAAGTLR